MKKKIQKTKKKQMEKSIRDLITEAFSKINKVSSDGITKHIRSSAKHLVKKFMSHATKAAKTKIATKTKRKTAHKKPGSKGKK